MIVTPFLISKLQRNKTANHVIYKENVELFARFGVKSQSIQSSLVISDHNFKVDVL